MRAAAAFAWIGLALLAPAFGQDPPPRRTTLPDEHEYQRVLKTYLGSLTEKDFDHGITEPFTTPPDADDPELRFRHWHLSLINQPLIGSKRGSPSVGAPARLFTLAAIESPQGVQQPPLSPEPVAYLVTWNYAGNPYFNSRAMKLRTFAELIVLLTMLDEQIEHAPELGGARFDSLAPSALTLSWPYPAVKDVVAAEAREAYEAGLRKMVQRLLTYDIRALQPNGLAVGPVALWSLGEALGDEGVKKSAEELGRKLWTDPAYFHPAGYYVDRGGMDLGYAGSTNIFTTWAALATKWPFAREALAKAYRLKAHLALPEPDGRWLGPTHFNTRLGSDPHKDQWEWGVYRDSAAALVTDEAVHLTKAPTAEELADGAPSRARAFLGQINENGMNVERTKFLKNEELTGYPWKYRLWQNWSFPLSVNYASVYTPPDAYAHRMKLEAEQSPWLKSPWEREPTFLRSLEKEFTFVKEPGYRAIVHSGQVGGKEGQERADVVAPFLEFAGFGGGQLSAFWTPATGSVILGRRGGASRQKNFDTPETWRQWPIHAVSGLRDGKVFTSARVRQPEVAIEGRTVAVAGRLPADMLEQQGVLSGAVDVARKFTLETDGVRVATSVKSDGQDLVTELYETIPVFLRETSQQPDAVPTTIEFVVGDKPVPAGTTLTEGVTAIRLTRFKGSVEIVFDAPQRVKLAPEEWVDAYMSRAACRNILIDLLPAGEGAKKIPTTEIRYRLRPAAGG